MSPFICAPGFTLAGCTAAIAAARAPQSETSFHNPLTLTTRLSRQFLICFFRLLLDRMLPSWLTEPFYLVAEIGHPFFLKSLRKRTLIKM